MHENRVLWARRSAGRRQNTALWSARPGPRPGNTATAGPAAPKQGTRARPIGPNVLKTRQLRPHGWARCPATRHFGPPGRSHCPKTRHFGPTDRAQRTPFQHRCSNASAPSQPSPLQLQRRVSTASVPLQDRFGTAAAFSATSASPRHCFCTAPAPLRHRSRTASAPPQHRHGAAAAPSTASAPTPLQPSQPLQHCLQHRVSTAWALPRPPTPPRHRFGTTVHTRCARQTTTTATTNLVGNRRTCTLPRSAVSISRSAAPLSPELKSNAWPLPIIRVS